MDETVQRRKIAEGKTKVVWFMGGEGIVSIENKDDITAGDGERHDSIVNKGVLATETTCNCFSLLNKKGVYTHFIERRSEREFKAIILQMIPIELVVRRIAFGSYLKRHPDVSEGTVFKDLVFELFLKDDALHDPLMVWNQEKEKFDLYNPKAPISEGYLSSVVSPEDLHFPPFGPLKILRQLLNITFQTFLILEEAWQKLGVTLVDLKIECGLDRIGRITVGDVIDNDSWRIWPHGDKTQMRDKQVYRDSGHITPEVLDSIKENYAWVAKTTSKFLT